MYSVRLTYRVPRPGGTPDECLAASRAGRCEPSTAARRITHGGRRCRRQGVGMTSIRSVVSLLVLAAPALGAQSAKPIPVRDFFRNPAKAYFQVSQGGKYVSYTEPYQSRMNITVRPVAGGEARRITAITDRDIASYGWKGDDRVFFFKDSAGNENFHLYVVDRVGTKTTDLTPMPKVRVDLVDELLDSPTDVLVQM